MQNREHFDLLKRGMFLITGLIDNRIKMLTFAEEYVRSERLGKTQQHYIRVLWVVAGVLLCGC